MMNFQFEYHQGLYMYPSLYSNEWENLFLHQLSRHICHGVEKIKTFIPISIEPFFYVINSTYSDLFRKSLTIPSWTKAFTIKNDIYILTNDPTILCRVINHELFHFAIINNNIKLPLWLNEALANLYSCNTEINIEFITCNLKESFESFLFSLETMSNLPSGNCNVMMLKSIAIHLFGLNNLCSVQSFLNRISDGQSVDQAYEQQYGSTIEISLKNWYITHSSNK
jgi:hypothetical protein